MRPERTLRIIAGHWRGRKFRFPPLAIRPTPDRVRETLFNWLQDRIAGARCLDLFAGSGALGLEALSRGAAEVVFVEQQRAACAAIEQLLRLWRSPAGVRGVATTPRTGTTPGTAATPGTASVLCADALRYLGTSRPRPFEVVFLDPPYEAGLLPATAAALENGWLASDARIYVEHARRGALPTLPRSWRELRAGRAGEVGYHLFVYQGAGARSAPDGRTTDP